MTVRSRLVANGAGEAGRDMTSSRPYKTTTSGCSGVTGADGVAACSRGIGGPTKGYRVNVGVVIDEYSATTWFTPH